MAEERVILAIAEITLHLFSGMYQDN